jgi:hypothetical protein
MEEYIRQNYESFSTRFYGFSSGPNPWQKRFMAIGLEERGCRGQNPLPEACRRIRAWQESLHEQELVNLNCYLNQAKLFNDNGKAVSNTWDRLADLFRPILGLEAMDCYGDHFRHTIAQEIILSEIQPLACPGSNNGYWPWGNWLPDYPKKPAWIRCIGSTRSQYIAQKIQDSQSLKLCVIYGKIGELRNHFTNRPGVEIIQAPDNPCVKALNPKTKTVVFVPHPGWWRFNKRQFTAKEYFTILGQSLAGQINVNPRQIL